MLRQWLQELPVWACECEVKYVGAISEAYCTACHDDGQNNKDITAQCVKNTDCALRAILHSLPTLYQED